MNKEIFKDIPWYDWLYKISNMWKVLMTWRVKKYWTVYKKIEPYYYLPRNNWKYKHQSVTLNNKKFYIHRLVWQAFLWLDINDSKTFVCHKDDNPLNNNVDNLFLWSCKDNYIDMFKKWRMAVNKMLPQTRLSEDIIRFIKDSKWKINQPTLAKMFNINQSHISRIYSNKARKYA